MTNSKKKSNNKAWTFVALFEGTDNDDGNKSIISKINDAIDKDRQSFWVKKVEGSGNHGNVDALRTGGDWPEIIEEMYEAFHSKIKDEGIAISQIDFYVFGFSRGAYQAKIFCNAIDMYGFKLESNELIKKLKQGADDTNQGKNAAKCGRPRIKLLGLFDTVCATKSPPPGLEDPGIPSSVEKCRHAVAANEYRERFNPQLIVPSPQCSKYEEQLFPGCHSDVGWAYDRMSEPSLIERVVAWCLGNDPNQTSTKWLGRYAYSWVVGDAATALGIDEKIKLFTDNPYAFEYVRWTCCIVFLIHDSYKEPSNFLGETIQRNLSSVKPCKLIDAVRTILTCNVLKSYQVSVEMIVGQSRKKNKSKEVSGWDLLSSLVYLDGNAVWMPSCITQNNHDAKQQLLNGLIASFRGQLKVIYEKLRTKGIVKHGWTKEYSAMTCYYINLVGFDNWIQLVVQHLAYWCTSSLLLQGNGIRGSGPIGGVRAVE